MSGSDMPEPGQQIAEPRARAGGGDRNAAGRLGELLAGRVTWQARYTRGSSLRARAEAGDPAAAKRLAG